MFFVKTPIAGGNPTSSGPTIVSVYRIFCSQCIQTQSHGSITVIARVFSGIALEVILSRLGHCADRCNSIEKTFDVYINGIFPLLDSKCAHE